VAAFSPGIATVTLDHVTISGNRFNDTRGPWGGGGLGTFANGAATIDVTVRDSVFSRNTSRTNGGAIFLNDGAGGHVTFTAERVTLQGNSATLGGGALAVLTDSGTIDAKLSNCFASGNMARQDGGAVAADVLGGTTLNLTIENCSFTANTASTGSGGAMHVGTVDGTFAMAVRNTIAWHNTAKVAGDDIALGPTVTVTNCQIAHSNVGEVDGICDDGGGNVLPAVDPKFMTPRGPNLHLKATSPLRGLGNCALGPSDEIDGQSRPQGAGCDIGADEIP
jgi:hypothetical protein